MERNMNRDRFLMTEDFVIKLYPSSYKEAPIIEIKGCALLNADRLEKIVDFFEQQTGQDLVAKIEFEAELW